LCRPARTSPPISPAINNFIDSGMYSIRRQRQKPKLSVPSASGEGCRRPCWFSFDHHLDTEKRSTVDVDQKGLGNPLGGPGWVKNVPNGGKVLEIRGVAGTSVAPIATTASTRRLGTSGKKWEGVAGGSASGTIIRPAQKGRPPDAIAVQIISTASPRRAVTPAGVQGHARPKQSDGRSAANGETASPSRFCSKFGAD